MVLNQKGYVTLILTYIHTYIQTESHDRTHGMSWTVESFQFSFLLFFFC